MAEVYALYAPYTSAMEINAIYVGSARHLASAVRVSLEEMRAQTGDPDASTSTDLTHFHQLVSLLTEASREPWDPAGAGTFSKRLSNRELIERSADTSDLIHFLAEACSVLEHLAGGNFADLSASEKRFATHRLEPFLLRMTVIGR